MFELSDRKVGDDVVDPVEESVNDIQLQESEVSEFVQLLDNKMDDYSN